MRVSYYEMYEAGYGKWSLVARYVPKDEAQARQVAEKNWTERRIPTILTQELIDEDGGEMDITAAYRSPRIPRDIKPPDTDSNVAGSFVTVAINGIIIGAIGGVIGVIVLADVPGRFFLAFLIFLLVTAAAMMVLFRMMVPAELMMWRTKTADAKRKTIAVLMEPSDDLEEATPTPVAPPPGRQRKMRKGAFSHSVADDPPPAPLMTGDGEPDILGESQDGDMAMRPAPESPDDMFGPLDPTLELQDLIANQVGRLNTFAAEAVNALGPGGPALQSFDRYGFNLYLAGAAQELAWREALTEQTLRNILTTVITDFGTTADSAEAFCARLLTAMDRPRFKAVMDAGREAMAASLDGQPPPDGVRIDQVLGAWSNPHGGNGAGLQQRYAVLLTDLVGSTDATRKLGNTGAQRLLRAHNAIVRSALKEHKGTEIKHTGDGILAIFTSPVDAALAGVAIQQDSAAYIRDNPDLPLAIRLGVEYGDGAKDETGEYFGPAFTAIEAICDAGGNGDVVLSPTAKEKSEGAVVRCEPLTPSPTAKCFVPGLFKVTWQPKPVYNVPPLEYRQIGTQQ